MQTRGWIPAGMGVCVCVRAHGDTHTCAAQSFNCPGLRLGVAAHQTLLMVPSYSYYFPKDHSLGGLLQASDQVDSKLSKPGHTQGRETGWAGSCVTPFARKGGCAKAAYSRGAGGGWLGHPRPRPRNSLGAWVSSWVYWDRFHRRGRAACLVEGTRPRCGSWLCLSSGFCWQGVTRGAGPGPGGDTGCRTQNRALVLDSWATQEASTVPWVGGAQFLGWGAPAWGSPAESPSGEEEGESIAGSGGASALGGGRLRTLSPWLRGRRPAPSDWKARGALERGRRSAEMGNGKASGVRERERGRRRRGEKPTEERRREES